MRFTTIAPRAVAATSLSLAALLALSACDSASPGEASTVPPATSTPSQAPPGETEPGSPTPEPTASADASAATGAGSGVTGPVAPTGATRIVASNFDLPWSMVRVEGDFGTASTFVSERDTALVKEVGDDGSVRVVGTVPGVQPGGEGGLLGLAVHTGRNAESDTEEPAPLTSWLYAYTTTATDNRVIRMPLSGAPGSYSLGEAEPLLTGIAKAGNHNGGRIKFGPDGMLYVTSGDAGIPGTAQDPGSLNGKILRLTPDGDIPADNPDPASWVYSLGHRNPQGIAWDGDGRLWAAEFGQNTWDELNLVEAGKNYGWPVVEGIGNDTDYVNPVYQWATSEASPSGLLWTNNTLFLAALRGERLWGIQASPESVSANAYFGGEFGRLRDVIERPDGSVWILTNNTGRTPRDGDDKIIEVALGALEQG